MGPDPLIGTVLGDRYRLEVVLGRGGMGTVYEATQIDLGRKVAIKVLNLDLAHDPSFAQRMQREARAVAAIDHPAIVQVSDFQITAGGLPFLVMERLTGRSLHAAIASEAPMPAARVLHITGQVLAALSAAHARGLVHRDVKPDNIFLVATPATPDYVKLLDFGVAKPTASPHEAPLSRVGAVIGTTAYMAPEQARGEPVDARADLYAVGACMYEALLGTTAIADAATAGRSALDHRVPSEVVRGSLRTLLPSLDPAVAAIVERALERERDLRFASAAEMLTALSGLGPSLVPPAPAAGSSGRVVVPSPILSPSFVHAPTESPYTPPPAAPPPPAPPPPAFAPPPRLVAPPAARRSPLLIGLAVLGALSLGTCALVGTAVALWGGSAEVASSGPVSVPPHSQRTAAPPLPEAPAVAPSSAPSATSRQRRSARRMVEPVPTAPPSPPPPTSPTPTEPPKAPPQENRPRIASAVTGKVRLIASAPDPAPLQSFGASLLSGPVAQCFREFHPLTPGEGVEMFTVTVHPDGEVDNYVSELVTGTLRAECLKARIRRAPAGTCNRPKGNCVIAIEARATYK